MNPIFELIDSGYLLGLVNVLALGSCGDDCSPLIAAGAAMSTTFRGEGAVALGDDVECEG